MKRHLQIAFYFAWVLVAMALLLLAHLGRELRQMSARQRAIAAVACIAACLVLTGWIANGLLLGHLASWQRSPVSHRPPPAWRNQGQLPDVL
jgi:hypothetical protein